MYVTILPLLGALSYRPNVQFLRQKKSSGIARYPVDISACSQQMTQEGETNFKMDDVHRKPLNVCVCVSGSTFNLAEATAVKTSGLKSSWMWLRAADE